VRRPLVLVLVIRLDCCLADADPLDPAGIVSIARREAVELVVIGPEASLAAGVADALVAAGVPVFGPSAAAARMARAVITDSGETIPVCAWVDGEYGISGVYLGVEAEVGAGGIKRVVERELTESELAGLKQAAEAVRAKQADIAEL